MADENDRATRTTDLFHLAHAAPLELRVADGQHLVDEQDVGLDVSSDGERESEVHPRRVALHRRVDEPRDT